MQVTGAMAMMMSGRVLLVCALCVLWCGAGGVYARNLENNAVGGCMASGVLGTNRSHMSNGCNKPAVTPLLRSVFSITAVEASTDNKGDLSNDTGVGSEKILNAGFTAGSSISGGGSSGGSTGGGGLPSEDKSVDSATHKDGVPTSPIGVTSIQENSLPAGPELAAALLAAPSSPIVEAPESSESQAGTHLSSTEERAEIGVNNRNLTETDVDPNSVNMKSLLSSPQTTVLPPQPTPEVTQPKVSPAATVPATEGSSPAPNLSQDPTEQTNENSRSQSNSVPEALNQLPGEGEAEEQDEGGETSDLMTSAATNSSADSKTSP
ncbi:mucin-associated surface protein (MASP), putative, partial [Trypanosoma cruzi marinkellei]